MTLRPHPLPARARGYDGRSPCRVPQKESLRRLRTKFGALHVASPSVPTTSWPGRAAKDLTHRSQLRPSAPIISRPARRLAVGRGRTRRGSAS